MAVAGSLVVELLLNAGSFVSDLQNSSKVMEQRMQAMEDATQKVSDALAGISANNAQIAALAQSVAAVSAQMQALDKGAETAGAAVDGVTAKIKNLLKEMSAEAGKAYGEVEQHSKTAALAIGAAVGVVATALGVGTIYATVRAVEALSSATASLFNGEAYKNQFIDDLTAANKKVVDLSADLGIATENAQALQQALAVKGGDQGSFAATFSAVETAARTNGEAFDRLGVKYKDAAGNLLSTQQIIANVAAKLNEFRAGYDRNAAAAELQVPSAKNVAEAAKIDPQALEQARQRLIDYQLTIGPLTTQAVAEYEKAMLEFRNESELTSMGFKKAIADAITPQLTELADLFKDGFPGAVRIFRDALAIPVVALEELKIVATAIVDPILAAFDTIGIEVLTTGNVIAAAAHGSMSEAKKAFHEGAKAIEDRWKQVPVDIMKQLDRSAKNVALILGADSKNAPVASLNHPDGGTYTPPPPKPAGLKVIDIRKQLLDKQLADLNAYIAGEKQILSQREQFLGLYYQNDEVAIGDFFTSRASALGEYIEKSRVAYGKEIAAIQAFIARADPKEALDGQLKLIDVRKRLAETDQQASLESVKDWFEQRKAVEAYQDKLASLKAQLLEIKGDFGASAAIRFDTSNRDLQKRLQSEGNTQGLDDLAALRSRTITDARLRQPQEAAGIINDQLRNAEQRIQTDQQVGAESELSAAQKLTAVRQDAVAQLHAISDQWHAIIAGTDDPRLKQNLANFDAQIQQLQASSDVLALRFQTIFEGGFTKFLDDLASGTKKFSDAVRDMVLTVASEFNHLAAQGLFQGLFGKDGPAGGVSTKLSELFRGASGSVAPVAAGTAANEASFAALNSGFDTLAGSAYRAAYALGSIGGGSASGSALAAIGTGGFTEALANLLPGDSLDNFIALSGFRADGGPVAAGKTYLVGERGPELFTPNTAGAVLPNHMLGHAGGPAPVVNVRNVNAFDTGVIGDYMGSDPGERVIVNVIKKNPGLIRTLAA